MDKVKAAVLGTSGRGSLYRWLRENHDEFDILIKSGGRTNWTAISAAFREDGLKDSRGNPPTAERSRQTWIKVNADLADVQKRTDRANAASSAISEHLRTAVQPKQDVVSSLKPATPPPVRMLPATRPEPEKPQSESKPEVDDISAALDAGKYLPTRKR